MANETILEFKSGHFTLPILRLMSGDPVVLGAELAKRLSQSPGFFRYAPVVIDLAGLADSGTHALNLAALVGLLRSHDMVPVGVRGGTPAQEETAHALELAVLSEARGKAASKEAAPEAAPAPPPEPPAQVAPPASTPRVSIGSKLVVQPVRSGQRVMAPDGDFVVIGSVSPGAELLAAGHIHVYGPLRGRALAGFKGNTQARIFCTELQAELLSIAGQYRVNEELRDLARDRPAQVYLRENRLVISLLNGGAAG